MQRRHLLKRERRNKKQRIGQPDENHAKPAGFRTVFTGSAGTLHFAGDMGSRFHTYDKPTIRPLEYMIGKHQPVYEDLTVDSEECLATSTLIPSRLIRSIPQFSS
jgi:hypothetical protein